MMANFADLKKRTLVSTICITLVALMVYLANNPIVQFLNFVVVGTLAIIGLWEYVHLLKVKKIELPFLFLSILLGFYVFANYLSLFDKNWSILIQIAIAAFFFSVFLYNFYRVQGAIINIAASFFGALYIVVPLALLLKVLYPDTISSSVTDGRIWFAYLLTVTKITDVGGYFAGKLWGRSKLAPSLSPGKTMIGASAGLILAVGVSLLFYLLSPYTPEYMFHLTLFEAVVLGGLIGIFSQLGDLSESLLKRDANVKDSNTIPGIGGVLDLLDSLFFTGPIVYLFLRTTG